MNQKIKLPPIPPGIITDKLAREYATLAVEAAEARHAQELMAYQIRVDRLEAELAQRGEPVAWMWRYGDGELSETPFATRSECERDAIGYEGISVPLYTAPQPAHTEAEVQELLRYFSAYNCHSAEEMVRRILGVQP